MHTTLLETIGNTPLVKIFHNLPAQIFAKLEYLNPGGSIKDRSALFMIEQAERKGILKPGMTLIDASSGNQGIALSMIGKIKGYKTIICTSTKISAEKHSAMKAYGATVLTFPPTKLLDDPNSYHTQAIQLQQKTPNSFMPNQYFSILNQQAHYNGIGKELWKQTQGEITHLIAAAGTGGTISGAGMFLKEQNPNIKIIAVDAKNSYRSTHGNPKPYTLEGMGVDSNSPTLNNSIIDTFIEVDDHEVFKMTKQLAHEHGFLVGSTSGAVALATHQYVHNLNSNHFVVIIFGDSGRAYLSRGWYD